MTERKKKYHMFKRLLDIIIGLIAFIVLFPFMIIIGVVIFVDSGSPILFKQRRIGANKTHFTILKFRTMTKDTPKDTPPYHLSNPESYITRVGKFLRKSGLDELPQLINIIKGDMSFVGPRPALWNEEKLINERDKYCANSIRPGLTGWAQINGRNELSIEEKAKFDGEYVKCLTIYMDFICIFRTCWQVKNDIQN